MTQERFYTYKLCYPESMGGAVFYVGKGTGRRIDDHEREARNGVQSYKCNVIRKIWREGEEIVKEKAGFFDDESAAYAHEMELIAFYGLDNLTNLTLGGEGALVYAEKRIDIHFMIPVEELEFIRSKTDNVNEWIVQAIERKIAREKQEREERTNE